MVLLFALSCGALFWAWMQRRLGVAAIVLFFAALAVWVAAFVVIRTGFHDANNFGTCGTDCSPVHFVAALGFLAPPLLIALACLGLLIARGSSWRSRRASAQQGTR